MGTALPEENFWVLIPARNEGESIGTLTSHCREYAGDRVLVVADNCTDRTAGIAERAGARVLVRRGTGGKGMALRAGWSHLAEESGCESILILDGDGQHDPSEIPLFLAARSESGADLVLGSRRPFVFPMPLERRLCNAFMSSWTSRIARHRISDSQCGYRLMSRRLFASAGWQSLHFEIETEIVLRACGLGLQIAEVPVSIRYPAEKSHISVLPDAWRWLDFMRRQLLGMSIVGRSV